MRWIVVLLLLSGCAQHTYWRHDPPLSDREFKHDLVRCNVMGNQMSSGTGGLMGLAIFEQQRDMCLEGEGWTRVKG